LIRELRLGNRTDGIGAGDQSRTSAWAAAFASLALGSGIPGQNDTVS
jgi:hypothetical protein